MIQKIKMLAKKAWSSGQKMILSAAQWGKPQFQKVCGLVKKLWDRLCQLLRKLWQFVKDLWMTSENRILLILIGAVLALLVLVLVFLLGIDWSNTVGICYRDDPSASNMSYRQALEQSLSQRGFEVIITDADGDPAKQLEEIEELSKRRCKALIVEPVAEIAGQELLDALADASVAAVLMGRMPENTDMSGYKRICCVEADPAQVGKVQAQMVMALPDGGDVNGDGTVAFAVLQESAEDREGVLLTQQFQTCLSENSVEHQLLTAGDAEMAWTQCADALTTYGKDIEVILCADDALTVSAAQAVRGFGLQAGKDIHLLGVGTDLSVLQTIAEGSVTGTVDTDTDARVQAVIDSIIALLGAQTSVPTYQAQFTAVTAENVGQYLPVNE